LANRGVIDAETKALVDLLDPERDYGDRHFNEVLDGIYNGTLRIEPGNNLPMLKEVANGKTIKGTGRPPIKEKSHQQTAIDEFRSYALDDLPSAYLSLKKGMERGDPRYDKIFWELAVGKVGELRGGGVIGEAMAQMFESMRQSQLRTIEAYEVE